MLCHILYSFYASGGPDLDGRVRLSRTHSTWTLFFDRVNKIATIISMKLLTVNCGELHVLYMVKDFLSEGFYRAGILLE
jgi:hypothetical protein